MSINCTSLGSSGVRGVTETSAASATGSSRLPARRWPRLRRRSSCPPTAPAGAPRTPWRPRSRTPSSRTAWAPGSSSNLEHWNNRTVEHAPASRCSTAPLFHCSTAPSSLDSAGAVCYDRAASGRVPTYAGCSSAWLERTVRDREVGSSNLPTPTIFPSTRVPHPSTHPPPSYRYELGGCTSTDM